MVAAEDRKFFLKEPKYSTMTLQFATRLISPVGAHRVQRVALVFVSGDELSHPEILHWFASETFFGQNCFGIASASVAYFDKPVDELRIEEAAFLAAVIPAPSILHPVRSKERAIARRNFVIEEMEKAGFISHKEASIAMQNELRVSSPLKKCKLP